MRRIFVIYCVICSVVSEIISPFNEEPALRNQKQFKEFFSTDEMQVTRKDTANFDDLGLEKESTREKQLWESESPEELDVKKRNETFKLRLQKLHITEENNKEIMYSLVFKFKENMKNEKGNPYKLLILKCLEHTIHDIEVACEFHDINGVPDVIVPTLHHPWPPLRIEAAYVLATVAQTCPRIQIASVEQGITTILLKNTLYDLDAQAQIYSMFAIRCLLRRYPEAQASFINEDGFSSLNELLNKQSENHLLQAEIISLLHDTLQEHNEAMKYYIRKDKVTQNLYKAVGLKKVILDNGWCSTIPQALLTQEQSLSSTPQKDSSISKQIIIPEESQQKLVEIISDTLLDLVYICHEEFKKFKLMQIIHRWKEFYDHIEREYQNIAEKTTRKNMKDSFYRTKKILNNLSTKLNKFSPKVEL